MTIERPDQLRRILSLPAGAQVQSLALADGVVTVVVEVSGLDSQARSRLERDIDATLGAEPDVAEVRVAMMAEKSGAPADADARPVRRIVAVGSGKGGVGKSTVSANLAVALARSGRKVGLVDADIYGPSQPRLMANEGDRPTANADKKLIPVPSQWGVPVLSIGHLAPPGQAIAWRGPMAGNALANLLDGDWGEVEILVVDLPPGTGDVHLTMMQRFKPAGAVIVSTPQDLALMDAKRAMGLFEQAVVPVIGIVENMAGYACPHCGEVSDPFGCGGAQAAAQEMGHPFLGRIPLDIAIRTDSDAGRPPAAGDGEQADAFAAIARGVADWLDRHPATGVPKTETGGMQSGQAAA